MVSPEDLRKRCTNRQKKRAVMPITSLASLPTLVDVEKALRKIQPNKTPGPDQLPNALFKYAASVLAPAVHDTFLKTFTWECEPLQNKGGWMIPIYKSGDKELARNYRGIMMLDTLGKCFHSWARQQLMMCAFPLSLEDLRTNKHSLVHNVYRPLQGSVPLALGSRISVLECFSKLEDPLRTTMRSSKILPLLWLV